MNISPRLKKLLALMVVLFVLGVVAWLVYDSVTFRLKATTPANNSEVSTAIPRVEFSFNKKLNDDGIADRMVVLVNGENPRKLIREEVRVEGGKVVVELATLDQDTDYMFSITDITAENGKKIDEVVLNFRTIYVPYNRLPKDQQQAAIEDVEDPETTDPIYEVTPYRTSDYAISYIENTPVEENPYGSTKTQKLLKIHITMTNADYSFEKKRFNQRKQRALNYLRSKGIDTSKYTIEYSQDPYLGPVR